MRCWVVGVVVVGVDFWWGSRATPNSGSVAYSMVCLESTVWQRYVWQYMCGSVCVGMRVGVAMGVAMGAGTYEYELYTQL
jgi:hypothetical protein